MRLETKSFDSTMLPQVLSLFANEFASYDKLLQPGYLQWLYECNPFGTAKIVQAFEGKVLIGFLAMIPVQLIVSEEVREAFHIVNVLVHPRYQGKKVFARMITSVSEVAASNKALLIGYPNPRSVGSWKRAGMQFHEPLVPKLIAPSRKRAGFRSDEVSDMTHLSKVLRELELKRAERQYLRVRLSPEFIAWRYVSHPTKKYRIQLVWRKSEAAGLLITERFYPGISLTLDHILSDGVEAECLSFLPWLTVVLEPAVLEPKVATRNLRLPVKKRIPVFCTDYARALPIGTARKLGASVSDF
jgi:GNAT superfamily N-acetyltransferase